LTFCFFIKKFIIITVYYLISFFVCFFFSRHFSSFDGGLDEGINQPRLWLLHIQKLPKKILYKNWSSRNRNLCAEETKQIEKMRISN